MEEQINSFDYTKNAEKLTERKWGKHVVSIWDGPDAQPARRRELWAFLEDGPSGF